MKLMIYCTLVLAPIEVRPQDDYTLYRSIVILHKVSPSVVDPPSERKDLSSKTTLVTFKLGEKVAQLQLPKNHENAIIEEIKNRNPDEDLLNPLFFRGKDFILKSPGGDFFLIFYEIDDRMPEKLRGTRFSFSKLLNIAENELLFVQSDEPSGTSYDSHILDFMKQAKLEKVQKQ